MIVKMGGGARIEAQDICPSSDFGVISLCFNSSI